MARYFPAALAALSLTAPVCSHAQTAAFSLKSNIFSYAVVPPSSEMGFRFTVGQNASVPVYGLGFYSPLTAGLLGSHAVGIFNDAGVLLVQGVVSAGTASPAVGDYRYTSQLFDAANNPLAAPLQLTGGANVGGTAYTIEALSSNDPFVYLNGSSDLGIDPSISPFVSYSGNRFTFGATTLSLSPPQNDRTYGFFAGNILITPFAVTPEPGAYAFLVSGMVVAGMTWRRRGRKACPVA